MAGHGRLDPAAAAECSVIGCLMMDAGKCGGVFEVATAEMFEGVDTRKLFEACVLEHEAGRPIDPVTVADKAGGDSRNVAAMCAEIAPTSAGRWNMPRLCGKTGANARLQAPWPR